MNKIFKIMGIVALMTGMTTGAMAQEQTQETDKPGFFKQAFRDMKESAKRQREIYKDWRYAFGDIPSTLLKYLPKTDWEGKSSSSLIS